MAPRKPATKKRNAQLRKAHSHIKATKTRKRRPEVDKLLGVTSNIHVHALDSKAFEEAVRDNPDLVDPAKAFAGTAGEPKPSKPIGTGDGSESRFKLHLDVEAIRQEVTSSLSPLEKAACDLMYALEATDGLVKDMTNRLGNVLKAPPVGGVIGHSERIETGIPYVDALNKRVTQLESINSSLRELLGRMAV